MTRVGRAWVVVTRIKTRLAHVHTVDCRKAFMCCKLVHIYSFIQLNEAFYLFIYLFVCLFIYLLVLYYIFIQILAHATHISVPMYNYYTFYLTTHSTHFIYGYMASDIWLRTILIVRKETRCRHIGYSYRLTARVLLYAPSHRQDNTYHGLCYTSRGALAGTRNSSMGPPHEGSIRRPTAP